MDARFLFAAASHPVSLFAAMLPLKDQRYTQERQPHDSVTGVWFGAKNAFDIRRILRVFNAGVALLRIVPRSLQPPSQPCCNPRRQGTTLKMQPC
jgi:hypothetical protein